MKSKELKECLCCGSKKLVLVLDLGEQPLANSFKSGPEDPEDYFPLKLNRCEECSHLQLSCAVDPDLLFKHYLYVSGTSQTLRDYFDWFANYTQKYFSIPPTSVLDIACNDGSQLDSFKALGLTTYGIDPAENLYKQSSAKHEVICDYFTEKYIDEYAARRIDIINAQNVFAHNSYPLQFLQHCYGIMHDNSMLFIQTSQANMILNNEFDTIYHEHLSFFNISSMQALANRSGLFLVDVDITPVHGTSYVFVFQKKPSNPDIVNHMLKVERHNGLQDPNTYIRYATRCNEVVKNLTTTIEEYRNQGYEIIGYGAAAKGNTLLNFGKIKLDLIIDDNPLKQGLYTPGTNILVESIDILEKFEHSKILFIPLAWNFYTEICARIKSKRASKSDAYVKYFPTITVETTEW